MAWNRLATTCLLLVFSLVVMAQDYRYYYEIKFTDKGNLHSINSPLEFLSQRAIERREKALIQLEQSDLPVSLTYLSDVLSKPDVHYITKSKWFNTLIIGMQDSSAIQKLRTENYVKSLKLLPYSSDKSMRGRDDKFKEVEVLDPVLSDDYGQAFNQFDMLNGSYLHRKGNKGEGLLIAVIDAGFINVNSAPAFVKMIEDNRLIATYDFVDNDEFVFEKSTHGSHVLSTMAADEKGVMIGTAPEASYILLRSEDGATEYILEEYFWVAAAEFADSAGADLLNTSLGYTQFDDSRQDHTYEDLNGNTTIITRGADKAASKGMLVINSAGNSGNNDWFYIGAPADGDSVLAIGAVNSEGDYVSFSSKGPSSDGRVKPNVSAQGLGAVVAGTEGGSFAGSGTSFSSPILSGLAACLWQANPEASNMDIFYSIQQSGSQFNSPDSLMGFGIPDLGFADLILKNKSNRMFLSELQIYPNPFIDQLTILFGEAKTKSLEVIISDFAGRGVYNHKSIAEFGGKRFEELNGLNFLQAGYYIITVKTDDTTFKSKIVKY